MAWTYSGDPSASDLDWLRFKINDTDEGGKFSFQDEEILGALADATSRDAARIELLRLKAQGLAATPNFGIGRFREDFAAAAQALEEKADAAQAALAAHSVGLFTGGISHADKDAREADTDRVAPAFRKGMNDFPAAGASETDE